jgi:predicted phosphate transport protein (TIGR00153 family)
MARRPIFSRLFDRSPITPIQKHMQTSTACAEGLIEYMNDVLAGHWEAAEIKAQRIAELEDEADELKRQIRLSLPRSLFMPVSRSDLLELVRNQDTIANVAKDIVGLILGRKMKFPDQMHAPLKEYLAIGVRATSLANNVLSELTELIVSGFSGREIDLVEGLIDELHTAESESDLQQIAIRKILFAIETDLDPVDVMFTYKVLEWVGDLADNAQTVGNRMLYLIAR